MTADPPRFSLERVQAADWQRLLGIARSTFQETFSGSNDAQNMRDYLEVAFSEARFRAELSHHGSQFFLLLEGAVPVGYLKLNFGEAQTEQRGEHAMEIERIYVSQAQWGQGLGLLLLEQALAVAQEQGMQEVWLGVWEENARAIAFYRKHGFEVFGQHLFRLGADEQVDLLMRRAVGP